MGFYFDRFEDRKPEPPLPYSPWVEAIWQFLLVIALVIGGWYIAWRWTSSLNMEALWYAIPLVVAETGAYIGLLLFGFNLWKVRDYPMQPAPSDILQCLETSEGHLSRPVKVDIFIATYSEDEELVRLSIRDAKKVSYPGDITLRIHVLDDGRREAMRKVCDEEGVNYISRGNNVGFKAGNLRNAMEQTDGDFMAICDADTRLFPSFLENTLGYFRDPQVAWVQTPQWFYDIPEGTPLPKAMERWLGAPGRWLGRMAEALMGPIRVGQDPFVNDPKMFYDIIMRRRNPYNASFCCGAGSIHRREAVMEAALKGWVEQVDHESHRRAEEFKRLTQEDTIDASATNMLRQHTMLEEEFTPYKFHVSEDIYTSIVLHSDLDRKWKSVMHPQVESKMLSPQDLLAWSIQRFKYAGGTLDITLHDNPLTRKGLTTSQRVLYGATIWSYLGGIWNVLFLIAPLIYLFTAIAPVSAYSMDFYVHILPFLFATELAFMAAYWGLASYQAKANYISFFPINLRALWTVLRGEKIKFPVTPKDRQEGTFIRLVWAQLAVIALTVAGLIFAWISYLFFYSHHNLDGLLVNTFWGINNIWALMGIVLAAFWKPEQDTEPSGAST
ncbi:MAG: glycosyltransferase [Halothiobacillaceae bacterium]|nr:MAG: glycosyltransferase [Halothiobacillaceae bacterium]